MKAAYIERYGAHEKLVVGEVPAPELREGDVLVRVRAASVNPIDFKVRDGALRAIRRYRFPLVLGHDLAGIVERVGAGVSRFAPGDAVFGRVARRGIGTFAESVVADPAELARMPGSLDFVQAASLPLVGLTCWQALVEVAQLQAGQKILIHAGSGGVGSFAIQLAKDRGAFVTATTSGRNAELVRALGADLVVDYTAEDFSRTVRGQDVVFATLGGDALYRSFRVLAPGGILVSLSAAPDATSARQLGLGWALMNVFRLMSLRANLLARRHRARYRYVFMRPSGEQLALIAARVDAGAIRPVVDRVYPLARAQEALAYSESGHARGKVVIEIGGR